jgi:uncharacterized protein YjbI with pentapeptide repeats
VFLLGVPAEYFWREEVIRQNYRSIENATGTEEEKTAVLNLAGGCWVYDPSSLVPQYFRERMFGNCRSLQGSNLSRADLSSTNLSGANLNLANLSDTNLNLANLSDTNLNLANLRGADLISANLSRAYLRSTNLSGAYLEGVQWDKDTKWDGINGWDTVKNIPPELKKQLNLSKR